LGKGGTDRGGETSNTDIDGDRGRDHPLNDDTRGALAEGAGTREVPDCHVWGSVRHVPGDQKKQLPVNISGLCAKNQGSDKGPLKDQGGRPKDFRGARKSKAFEYPRLQ